MEKRKWYKKWWGIALIAASIIILSFSFAFALAVFKIFQEGGSQKINSNSEINKETLKLIEGGEHNYWLGSADPKITIVEFSDFSCPYCAKSFPKIREISKKYHKDVKIIYRDLPILTEFSSNLALAARCAGEQGLFWLMHDKLFINQGNIAQESDLFDFAKEVGANENRFEACYQNRKYLSDIQKDYNDATALKIASVGTPIWFINGHQVSGDIPKDVFEEIIEKMLQEEELTK